MNKNNYAIIMAGGVGTRFWPKSKKSLPKQFIDILNTGETLIQSTYKRLCKCVRTENIYVVTNKNYAQLCIDQLKIKKENIFLEPIMRNTAPCIAYSSFKIKQKDPEANILVCPSDHIVHDDNLFSEIIEECLKISSTSENIVTLGINPTRPDTGYGYIQYEQNESIDDSKIKKVKTFTEKPSQSLALQFIDSGDFLWNSGMFIFNVNTIINSFKTHLNEIYEIFNDASDIYWTAKEVKYIERFFPACKNISVDYGILEKSDNVYVYPSNFGWSDLGTWGSIYSISEKDENQNIISGEKVIAYDCTNSIFNISDDKLLIAHGLDNYIVIESNNNILICKKEDEQKVKNFVNDIKVKFGDERI